MLVLMHIITLAKLINNSMDLYLTSKNYPKLG